MSIKFWTSRHKNMLYNHFDEVRNFNFSMIDIEVIKDMFDKKFTEKDQRRIENEWNAYWDDVFDEIPKEEDNLFVIRINDRSLLLLKAEEAIDIGVKARFKHEKLFNSSVEKAVDES